jgi:hypothetical protein
MAARAATSNASTQWSALTAGQREAWNLYAASVPLIDRLGAQIQVSGINMFVRSGVPRIMAGLDMVLDGPTELSLGTTPSLVNGVVDVSLGQVIVDGHQAEAIAGDYLLVSVTRPVGGSRTPAHEPTHFLGAEEFVAGIATSTLPAFFPYSLGQAARIWGRITFADGRLSPWAYADVLATA